MYSEAYVTDFDSDDSDDDNVVRSPNNKDEDDDDDLDSVSTVKLPRSRQRVYEFGEKFEETYGWVQCRSRSQPNRPYFHNMHSNCDTWYRPLSRHVDIPYVSTGKANYTDNLTTDSLELMSISDDEKERDLPGATRDYNKSSMKTPLSIFSQLYYDPRMNWISEGEDNFSDSCDTLIADETDGVFANDQSNGSSNDSENDSRTKYSPLSIENFLETSIVVYEGEVNTECRRNIKNDSDSASSLSSVSNAPTRVMFGAPRLKKISFEEQIVKWQGIGPSKNEEKFRMIVREMNGVRTISYDPPNPEEVRPEVNVKTTLLSDSDSDNDHDNEPFLSSDGTRKKGLWNDCDFVKNLCEPALSSSSSSSSSSNCSSSCSCSRSSSSSSRSRISSKSSFRESISSSESTCSMYSPSSTCSS